MIEKRKKVPFSVLGGNAEGGDDVEDYDKKKYRVSTGYAVGLFIIIVIVVCFVFKIDIRTAISSPSAYKVNNGRQDVQAPPVPVAPINPPTNSITADGGMPPLPAMPLISKMDSPKALSDAAVTPGGQSREEVELETKVSDQIAKLRHMKFVDHVVMETSDEAKREIAKLQEMLRRLLKMQYGEEPYTVEMRLRFPDAMVTGAESDSTGGGGGGGDSGSSGPREESIIFALGPAALVPYSVYNFLQVIKNFQRGAFHRNAGHVLQAMVNTAGKVKSLAFQEYHPEFPHKKYTLGYAGRPGGPEFYISTVNNVGNHGPGSQGSKTEADSCFGKIIHGIDVVHRMQKQPGADKVRGGFVTGTESHIKILSLKLLPSTPATATIAGK